MPQGTFQLDPTSRYAFLQVSFGLQPAAEAVYRSLNLPIPTPVVAKALIDTGATHTSLNPSIRAALGLPPTGSLSIASATHPATRVFTFPVRIYFPPSNLFRDIVVSELPSQSQAYDCLIGCDMLSLGVLIYNGAAGQFTLCLQ